MATTRAAHPLTLAARPGRGERPCAAPCRRRTGGNECRRRRRARRRAADADQSRLRVVDRRRRQSQRARRGVVSRARRKRDWRPALPLLRLHGERIYSESRVDVVAPNMFAGSILDLEPGTEYEARFVLSDPDGVRGEAERTAVVRTRAEPMRYRDGRVFHVYPHGYAGTQDRARIRRAHVRVQRVVRGHGLGDGRPAARARPATRSSSTPASINTTATSTRTTRPSIARRRSTARII